MQWTTSISEAVNRSRANEKPMLILLEPPKSTSTHTTSAQLLQTLSNAALHNHLFTHPQVLRLLFTAQIIPLRIVAEQNNPDYVSFQAFFQHSQLPELVLVNFDGGVLWRGLGYTSPRVFVDSVSALCEIVTQGWFGERPKSAVLVLPPTPSPTTAPTPAPTPVVSKGNKVPKSAEREQIRTLPKKGMKLTKRKTMLRVRLPTGATITHEYLPDTKFHNVKTWLSEESNISHDKLRVSIHFPHHVFSPADDAKMISELGLCPSANLVVAVEEKGEEEGVTDSTGVGSRIYAGLASGRDLVTGFLGSFFRASDTRPTEETQDVDRERNRNRNRGIDDEALRYNGNSTQFGYDDDR